LKRLKHIFALNVGEIAENIVNGVPDSKLAKKNAYGHTRPFDARFAAHHSWSTNDAVQCQHGASGF